MSTDSESGEEHSSEQQQPDICGYEKDNGEPCQIPVSDGGTCHQHPDPDEEANDEEVEEAVEEADTQGGTSESTEGREDAETILYCFPRAAMRTEDVQVLKEALNAEGYFLEPSSGDGDQVMIQRAKSESEEMDIESILDS